MLKKTIFFFMTAIFVSLGFATGYAQDDVEGSEDHPMISRYEGSVIKGYEQFEYDRAKFPSGKEDGELQTTTLEGKLTKIFYRAPERPSVLQVQRNYQMALQDAGFEILYKCDKHGLSNKYIGGMGQHLFYDQDAYYILARMPGEEGHIYASIAISGHKNRDCTDIFLRVLEEKPMPTGKVKVNIDAETMAEDIDEKGSVSIYGIHFDTDKATIKEKSESTLAEIASLLEEKPELNLGVVGHTDATGNEEHNMGLSKRRADAVVEFLTSEYSISKDRLKPRGVGPWAPVASNEDEDGRARNRRVELVKIVDE
ncbi:MAG: OmpA family protein [Bacteroidales bacterium]|nr:OmpA family protein [Bacteroidales bacterium]